MTRENDIINAAWDYFQDLDSHHFHLLPHCNPQTDAFEAGAKWADETMIDKACDWLEDTDFDMEYWNSEEGFCKRDFIEDFRKAMEE